MRFSRLMIICLVLIFAVSMMSFAAEKKVKPSWWGNAPGQNAKPVARGTVANISPSSIGVTTKEGVKSFAIDAQTKVMIRGKKAAIADVKVGDPVVVRLRPAANNTLVANAIVVPNPSVKGKITAIEGSVITIADKDSTKKVTVTSQTKYLSKGYKGAISNLRIGYGIVANGSAENGQFVAKGIEFMPEMVKGTVIAVNGNTVIVKSVRQAEITGQVTDATAITVRPRVAANRKGTLADIKQGMPVNIGFEIVPNAPARILWIDLLTGE